MSNNEQVWGVHCTGDIIERHCRYYIDAASIARIDGAHLDLSVFPRQRNGCDLKDVTCYSWQSPRELNHARGGIKVQFIIREGIRGDPHAADIQIVRSPK